MTNNSILKLGGAFHWVKTSRIRFWAFSYSAAEPCGRSDQVSMYFMVFLFFGGEKDYAPIIRWREPQDRIVSSDIPARTGRAKRVLRLAFRIRGSKSPLPNPGSTGS